MKYIITNTLYTHVYFDMDGVLTDLDKVIDEHNINRNCRNSLFGWMSSMTNYTESRLFETLPANPYINDFKNLIQVLKDSGVVVSTLTSLGNMNITTPIYNQKQTWLKNNGLDIHYLAVPESKCKQYLAHPKALLIDDKLSNVEEFRNAGGSSVEYSIANHDGAFDDILHELSL